MAHEIITYAFIPISLPALPTPNPTIQPLGLPPPPSCLASTEITEPLNLF